MPNMPYPIRGVIYNSFGNNISNALVIFTTSQGDVSYNTNSQGKYLIDLANAGYTSGETITYVAYDEFRNETLSGSFVLSGESKILDVNIISITSANAVPGNKDTQIYSIGAKPINRDNPLPVQVSKIPSNFDSMEITYDSSNNPTKVVKTFGTDTYTRNITWDANNNPIKMSLWVKG